MMGSEARSQARRLPESSPERPRRRQASASPGRRSPDCQRPVAEWAIWVFRSLPAIRGAQRGGGDGLCVAVRLTVADVLRQFERWQQVERPAWRRPEIMEAVARMRTETAVQSDAPRAGG